MPFLFILSGITIEKAALVFPQLIAACLSLAQYTADFVKRKYIIIFFLSFAFVFFCAQKKNESEQKNTFFFLCVDSLCVMEILLRTNIENARNLIQFIRLFSKVRYHIDRLSSCYLAVFHLQFIKINSYRYFGYDRGRKKNNNSTSPVTTTTTKTTKTV